MDALQLNSPPAEGVPLPRVAEACAWLEQTTSIPDIQDLHQRAVVYEQYWKAHADAFDEQNRCAEIRLRAEQRLGKLLKETVTKGGVRRFKVSSTGRQQLEGAGRSLPNGIDAADSHLYQRLSEIPEDVLLAYLATFPPGIRRARTSSGLRAFAERRKRETRTTTDIAPGGRETGPDIPAPPTENPPPPTALKKVLLTATTLDQYERLAKDFKVSNLSDTVAAVFAWACEERGL